jgi:hypothetical protein
MGPHARVSTCRVESATVAAAPILTLCLRAETIDPIPFYRMSIGMMEQSAYR